MKNKCLGCYLPLEINNNQYHSSCSKKLFGTEAPPIIEFNLTDLEDLAKKTIAQHLSVAGVQPKISLSVSKKNDDPKNRMMLIDLWGTYILKPPTEQFPFMAVVEDLTMHMAETIGIKTARHGLIKLKSGELAYITKRFDRDKNLIKLAVEDFCQLSELLTESKYNSSLEKAGKIILKYSSQPGLDAISFFDLNIFCFLTGNADMHLKNFSLIRNTLDEIVLSPAYDLISTKVMMPDDKEDTALALNGKKTKINRNDFIALGKNLRIADHVIENRISKILNKIQIMKTILENSFLPDSLKKRYNDLIDTKSKILSKTV